MLIHLIFFIILSPYSSIFILPPSLVYWTLLTPSYLRAPQLELSLDVYSWRLVGITMWVFSVIFLNLSCKIAPLTRSLLLTIFITFSSTNLIALFFWFEISIYLISSFILIERLQRTRFSAFFSILLYSLISSVPFIYYLSTIRNCFFLTSITEKQRFRSLLLLRVSLVKIPFFFFHAWLLKAHVEASIEGSIILAAIILKLGSYSIGRLINIIHKSENLKISLVIWGLLGSVVRAFIANHQRDIKKIVALSSVSHMSLSSIRIFIREPWGPDSSAIAFISHGFISSLLFYIATLSYKSISSRNLSIIANFYATAPILAILWTLALIANSDIPPFIGFLRETISSFSLFSFSLFSAFFFLFPYIIILNFNLYLFFQINKFNQLTSLKRNLYPPKITLSGALLLTPTVLLTALPFL